MNKPIEVVSDILISKLKLPNRKINWQKLSDLKSNISELGLLQPVIVSEDMRLITGLHRVEALRRLGRKTVPARVVPLPRMREWLCNLETKLSGDLSPAERADLVGKWQDLSYALRGRRGRKVPAKPGQLSIASTESPVAQAPVPIKNALRKLGIATLKSSKEDVRISDMSVDYTYQRPLSDSRVNDIASRFRPEFMDDLLLSLRRDRRYYIIDGQHRWAAHVRLGLNDALVPCRVFTGLTIEQEAELFEAHQGGSKDLSCGDRLRALRVMKEEGAVDLERIVTEAGYMIGGGAGNLSIQAISATQEVYANDNLAETLAVVSAWQRGRKGKYLNGILLEGISIVLRDYEGLVDIERLVSRLEEVGPTGLLNKAKQLPLGAEINHPTRAYACVHAIVKLYNKRLRTGLLEFPKPDEDEDE